MNRTSSAKPNGRMHGVTHHLPHRTRYRLASPYRNAETKKRIDEAISKVNGVKKIEFNERTGGLLVHHDEIPEIAGTLYAVLEGLADDLFEEICGEELAIIPGVSLGAHLIKTRFAKADRHIARMTNNYVDLKMLIPLGFLATALYQASKKHAWLESVSPLVLLYYAYDSYLKFNGSPAGSSGHDNGHKYN